MSDQPKAPKSETLTIRLNPELRAKLDLAISKMPYKPSITNVIERGLTLALDEMQRLTKIIEDAA